MAVSSADTEPYQRAIDGLGRLGLNVERLRPGSDDPRAVAAAVTRGGRDIAVVAFGAAAATAVAQAKLAATVPVVNCMVLRASTTRTSGPVDVSLEIPAQLQATWLQRLLPKARTVGILFDPVLNETRAVESADALERLGIAAMAEPVPNSTALPVALQRLQNHVDVVQALADPTVYSREHARTLLLFSFRHQIPLVGPTESWVKAGALFALDWDYSDLGRYCGALALRQLGGNKAPPPPPPRARVVANGRSADQLRIEWDEATLRLIDHVY